MKAPILHPLKRLFVGLLPCLLVATLCFSAPTEANAQVIEYPFGSGSTAIDLPLAAVTPDFFKYNKMNCLDLNSPTIFTLGAAGYAAMDLCMETGVLNSQLGCACTRCVAQAASAAQSTATTATSGVISGFIDAVVNTCLLPLGLLGVTIGNCGAPGFCNGGA